MTGALSMLGPVARAWFEEAFGEPTPAQELAWPALARGESALVVAPTGSGKTLAAFLVFLDRIARDPTPDRKRVRVLYITPLRALGNDIHRNLEVPLEGMREAARRLGEPSPSIRTGIRTGDTPQRERERLVRNPPDILITTPESLYLMLTSERASKTLADVEVVIVDEVHALAPNKRGTHLAISLERLAWLVGRPFQRVGLSATVRPAERVAAWLGGQERGAPRRVEVLDAGGRKEIDLLVETSVEDLRELPGETIWPSVYDELLELIRAHRSTLIFVNMRAHAERVAAQVNHRAGETICRVHHGSISRERRFEAEELLKAGKLPAIAATSSLELGIDIGSVDLVVQIESPKTVTAGLQRVGRAGHLVGEVARGRVIPKYRPDLLDAAAVARGMLRREVEETHVPEGCLDILAQQIAGAVSVTPWGSDALLEMVRGSYPYRDLDVARFEKVLGMLAGRSPAARFGELRPRIVWNHESREVRARPGTRLLAVNNAGAIPDRGYYAVVHSETGAKLGELDEQYVFEARVGDTFVLGSATWRIDGIDDDRVRVTEAPGAMPSIPFWEGDIPGRPYELGVRVGEFLRDASDRIDDPSFPDWLREECALGERAAFNLSTYLRDQREATGELPSDRTVVVEEFEDELGDRRITVHSPFGQRVHHAWLLVARTRIRDVENLEIEGVAVDDGFMVRFPARDGPVPVELIVDLPDAEDLEELLLRELQISPLYGALFREAAARALLLPRRGPGRRTPLRLQRIRSADLLQVTKRLGDFPVLLEAYREAWDDVLRVRDFRRVADGLASGEIAIHRVQSDTPSPFAMHFLFDLNVSLQYAGDQPRAEWRSQLMAVDRDLLSRVVRPDALRELLDERALVGVEDVLQRIDERSRPRNPDELADALSALGDLSEADVRRRVGASWREMVEDLERDGRAVRLDVGGEPRWVASELADEYRAFAAGEPEAARAIVRRHLAGRGPVTAGEIGDRYALPHPDAARILAELQGTGQVAAGEYRPHGTEREWVDADNLRRIHHETLRLLRKDIEPVDPERYAHFLLEWQGVARPQPSGEAPARAALDRLAGIPLPAASIEREVIGRRFRGGDLSGFERVVSAGGYLWQGMPGRRVAIVPREAASLLVRPPAAEPSEAAARVRDALRDRGASFLSEVAATAGLPEDETLPALFDLVWAGIATNDSFSGIREPERRRRSSPRRARSRHPLYGRWSLVPEPHPDVSERADAWAEALLAAYGVVARETATAAEVPVPWAAVSDALATREARGAVRRGYFVRGLSGVQYAETRAVERLRRGGSSELRVVAAADPANAYGPLLPVASPRTYRLARVPGTWLVVRSGTPLLAVESRGRRLIPLHDDAREALGALDEIARLSARGRLTVERWDDLPIVASEGADLLAEAGFSRGPRQMTYRAPVR